MPRPNLYREFSLIVLASITGLASGWATLIVSNYFFVLLPLAAFALGYFARPATAVIGGLLLLAAHAIVTTPTISGPELWPYLLLAQFVVGGFSLPLIAYGASRTKTSTGRFVPVATLLVLLVTTGWITYWTIPRYGYYYQVGVSAPAEQAGPITMLLPIGTVSEEPYADIFEHRWEPDRTTNALVAIIEAEHGAMAEFRIDQLEQRLDGNRDANMIFMIRWSAPRSRTKLAPRMESIEVDEGFPKGRGQPEYVESRKTIERFTTAVMVTSDQPHPVSITLTNRTDTKRALNFGVFRWKTFSEQFEFEAVPNGEWIFLRGEVIQSVFIDRPFD